MEERTLTDGTIWLSRPVEADIEAMVEGCRDPAIIEWVTVPYPYGRADAEEFLGTAVADGWAGHSPVWGIRTAEHGRLIGTVGLGTPPRDDTAAEIGFWLAPDYRKRGIISRAVALTCDFGFDPAGMGLIRIQWRAFAGNHASAAVARKSGFRYEGLARLAGLQRGIRRDFWVAARLNTDPPGPAPGWDVISAR
ncbi:GNAT family N-acetyltransferase [Nocardia sp. NPDC051750]|uniref:GNAT family N-acetyltransferase n=1 Tax=Nocardia sp. NPDC051750 TaxID=3364325 RepID=UPI0037AE79EB